ncbi:BRD4-interacting chromatin-remodeling complex-associated protein [Chanos chanos]|uniref:BRD4-interacting chromatin-remodeling complex-associated protein n=1 Tax=Chanos chanos TaxID=29144 RepID=A0A6J2WHL4_CHACN|nr:BRD4-interacting chromatin-remodeling complex-associated protein-like [Chanos chanos]
MEDEDGTCLLDVLCDPQALNDFLHGTNGLPSEDLLINSSSGEPSLFTDTPSPVSLLADDVGSRDTPASGCVDLSFLEEALLASPEAEGDPEETEQTAEVCPEEQQQQEEEDACDILQQSLQEADITEHTLALEAGLAQHGESISLYPSDNLLPSNAASYLVPSLPKPLSIPDVNTLQRDTQAAVEPPQPSLLAVGPGCPSLKPTAPQIMGLLPGNVFPAPTSEMSFTQSPTQGSNMVIQKALPTLTSRHVLTPAVRATGAPGILLQRAPLPIQPKLPVSIQPRLVQISPKPSSQKVSQGLTFVPATAAQNILLSPPVGPKQPSPPQPAPNLSKPVSLQLVNQGSSIVIQPQGLFQGQSQFFLPNQTPVTISQSGSTAKPLLTPASNQVASVQSRTPAASHLVDSSQVLTVPPRQLNFSPVFTTPTGQIALRQGAFLSGPLQLQSAQPTVFQVPAQLAGAYASQAQGQPATMVHSPALGNHITLINSSSMLTPDMTSISIVNGPSLVQGLPFASQTQKPATVPLEGQLNIPQTSLLLLPERPTAEEIGANEQVQIVQEMFKPLASPESLLGTLPAQTVTDASPVVNNTESSSTALSVISQAEALSAPPESREMPVDSVMESRDVLSSPPVGQNSLSTPPSSFPNQVGCGGQPLASARSVAGTELSPVQQVQAGPMVCVSPSTNPDSLCVSQKKSPPVLVSTYLNGEADPATQQHMQQSTGTPFVQADSKLVSRETQDSAMQSSPALAPRPHAQGARGQTTVQRIPLLSSSVTDQEERLTPAMRRHRVQQQLCMDHSRVINPNTQTPFVSLEDAVRHLLPYHTCARTLPSQRDFITVDRQFECVSGLLLKRTTDMLNKYRQLLLAEAQQVSPSAEMVMLERLFLQSERLALGEERRKARRDPASFLMSLRKSTFSRGHAASASLQIGRSGSPSSPPAWTLLSDRPPGLKTYRSSSKGALRLTIKHESGSRKVVHSSVCDVTNAHNAPSGHKRNYSRQLTNGGDSQDKEEVSEPLRSPELTPLKNPSGAQHVKLAEGVSHLSKESLIPLRRTGNLKDVPYSLAKPECPSVHVEPSLPDLSAPMLKRNRLEALEVQHSSLPPIVEDSALSEHLQSAIDSILELQRLQGPAAAVQPKLQQGHALEQSVSSMLEGQL